MLKNYFKTASRSLLKHKVFSFINILGLSVGISCCIIIWTYVNHEFSYESHIPNRENIFRVTAETGAGTQYENLAVTSNKIAPILKREFPEVSEVARFANIGGFRPSIVKYEDKVFQESKIVAADSTFLSLIPIEIIEGDRKTPLSAPKSVIISETTAQKYFGHESPIGKSLFIDNAYNFNVTAVYRNLPSNTHFDFESMVSFNSHASFINEQWFPMNYYTYVQLYDANQSKEVSFKLTDYVAEQLKEQMASGGFSLNFNLQPLSDIYFDQDLRGDLGARTSKKNIYAISFIGFFVLLIACINYINLTTAKSEKRAKEVGIRKVLGAAKEQLVFQFYGETLLITVISLIGGNVLAELILPVFNDMIGKVLFIQYGFDLMIIFGFTALMITIMSGLYPALYLSSFTPIKVLKSTFRGAKSNQIFRKLLVVVQFSITSFLILGTLVIYKQLKFTSDKKLGFDTEETILIPVVDRKSRSKIDILKSSLVQNSDIVNTSFSSGQMGRVMAGYSSHGEGMESGQSLGCYGIITDENFIKTLGIKMSEGSDFQPKSPTDSSYKYIINERLAKELGWSNEEAINKKFRAMDGMDGKIIGVTENFHFNSLRDKIEPLAIWVSEVDRKYLYVKIKTENHSDVLAYIEQQWKSINPDSPFEFSFLNAEIQSLYISEQRTAKLLLSMTLLSIIIGALGLFGLTAFIVERRTKEIGIKKVLGASVRTIMFSLSNEFMSLVIGSFVIAFPLAYYFIGSWLDEYAYRISIDFLPFIGAAIVASLIAFATVSIQTFKAAIANPVDALKEE